MKTFTLDDYDTLDQARCELALLRTLTMDSRPLAMDQHDMIGLYQVLDRLVEKLNAVLAAASLTTGGRWPDGGTAPRGDVLIWSGEDDPADTLVPRLLAAGAELGRVHVIHATLDAGETRARALVGP